MFAVVLAACFMATVSAQTGLCPAPNGDFPNPSSEQCTTFFRCIQGRPNLLRCPSNQRFDFLFRTCRQQRSVDCNNQLQVFAAPAAAGGAGGLGNGAGTFAGSGGLGILGGLVGGRLGAGLPDGGLVTLLSQLGAADGDGQNGSNSLATLLVMSALMNKRNTANQQDPYPPIAGQGPFYPSNVINSAVLPADQINNPIWQQPLGNYAPDGAGISPGMGITAADGRNYILVPQAQQGQGSLLPWSGVSAAGSSHYGGVPQSQSTLQLGQFLPQGQSNLLYNSALRGIGQLQLENMVALPPENDSDYGVLNSTSVTTNANNSVNSSDSDVLNTLGSASEVTHDRNHTASSDSDVLNTLGSASEIINDSNHTASSDSDVPNTLGSASEVINYSNHTASSDSDVLNTHSNHTASSDSDVPSTLGSASEMINENNHTANTDRDVLKSVDISNVMTDANN